MSLCGFDELLDFLLDKIALRGSEGKNMVFSPSAG